MTALNELTATEAGDLIAKREISSEELVRACLERIDAREDDVRAWQAIDPELALEKARAADAVAPASPLHGVPFGVKDVIDTADLPTRYGSPIFDGNQPANDAACVAKMNEAGAVLMGKTVSTEFATFFPGKTRNPHNFDHTPGGSSSGSAAAVGDKMLPIAFGNQTAGSLIRPAAYCGVFGLKPTHGTVDLGGIFELEPTFDTLGYMARSVDDLAAFYAIVRGETSQALADGIGRPPRVGICHTPFWDEALPESRSALEDAAKRFAANGADVDEMTLPEDFATLDETHGVILNVGLSRSLGQIYNEHGDQISERLRGMIESGIDCPTDRYDTAVAHATACRAAAGSAFGDWDVLLTPSAPGEAPAGLSATGNPIFQVMWTLLHVPCVTIPFAAGPNGLPVGVQLIGRPGDDETVLQTAKWFAAR